MKKKIRFDRETIVDVSLKVGSGLLKASIPVIFIVCATFVFYEIVKSLYINSTKEQLSFISNYQVDSEAQTLITIGTIMGIFLGVVAVHLSRSIYDIFSRMDEQRNKQRLLVWIQRKVKNKLEPLPFKYILRRTTQMDMSDILECEQVIAKLKRIETNTSNPEKAKQLKMAHLRESEKTYMEANA